MSYVDATALPEGKLAREFTLCDNFFQAAFGGSFLNHVWLIAAATPVFPAAPASMVGSPPDAAGRTVNDNVVTTDGYVVNTAFSVNSPVPPFVKDRSTLVPNQDMPTIGDRLSEKGISWAWYSGGWRDALAGRPDPLFQYHHQPFIFFSAYADGAAGRAHLADESDFLAALSGGSLPAVSFVKPLGPDNEHPGYASLLRGQQHAADLVNRLRASPLWKDTLIIITYDEYGGRWDHVAPPVVDRWGPGTRVPALIISPFARKGFIDHTQYDTTSILKLIEQRFGLRPLGARDAAAESLVNALDLQG
jgi:phospholipase C